MERLLTSTFQDYLKVKSEFQGVDDDDNENGKEDDNVDDISDENIVDITMEIYCFIRSEMVQEALDISQYLQKS